MSSLRLIAVAAFGLAVSTPSFAADAGTPPAPPSFRSDFLKGVDRVEQQLVSLEQAMPQAKFTWRPGKGVRSVAEVYLHVAGGIYFFMGQMGRDIPADVKAVPQDKWESQTTKKDEIKTILSNAFAFLRKSLADTSDADFDKTVKMFNNDWSERLVFMAVQGHCWEHLGQSIAYARTNGVVPPWSKPNAKD
jgi:uncharacterized damage-inducible protein DinB